MTDPTQGKKFHKHPTYLKCQPDWKTFKVLYDGRHQELIDGQYLWGHEYECSDAEGQNKRRIREQRSQYTNLMEPVVSRLGTLLCKEDPDVEEVRAMFGEEELANVDGEGKDLISFIKEDVIPALLLYGKPLVLVEGPSVKAENKEQEQAFKLRPYLSAVSPLELVDWDVETENPARRGQYNFVRIEYCVIGPRTDPAEQPEEVRYSKVFKFTGTGYTVSTYRAKKSQQQAAIQGFEPDSGEKQSAGSQQQNDDARWVQEGADVPVEGWDHLPISDIRRQESWVKDVAPKVLSFFNQESALDNILLHQAHRSVFILTEMSDDQKQAMTPVTVQFLNPGDDIKVIDPVSTADIRDRMEQLLLLVSRIAFNQSRNLTLDSKSVERAETQQESKQETIELAVSTITLVENMVNAFVRDYALMKDPKRFKDFKGKVKFNKKITIEDLQLAIDRFLAIRDDVVKVPRWHRAYLKKWAQEENFPDEKEILEDIDKTDFKPEDPAAQGPQGSVRSKLLAAFNGNTGQAPAADGPTGGRAGGGDTGVRAPAPALAG